MTDLRLDAETRTRLWQRVNETVETYMREVDGLKVAPELDPAKLRALLEPFDFAQPLDPLAAVDFIAENLTQYQVHTPHPRYYGLFNPAPTTMGIAADTLVAAFNPQMAAWSHSPLAVEIEAHLLRAFGEKFGYAPASTDGVFASGGAEANQTALLTALTHAFPAFGRGGARALSAPPVFYVSLEAHHSFLKAARTSGLGTEAVREIAVQDDLTLSVPALEAQIAQDRQDGFAPFMIVGTAGTTSAGVIDPLEALAATAEREGLWFHADAAWGGGAALVPELRPLLKGIERADSITFDAHKWLSVPMGAGIYLTRHPDILSRTFGMETAYMPRDGERLGITDPYTHSIQWSRRFTGLKVFLSLAVAGWEGYEAAIRHQTAMGDTLRRRLIESDWRMANQTLLPVVCFVDGQQPDGGSADYLMALVRDIVTGGDAWISTTRLGSAGKTTLRACITNYRTQPADCDALVKTLNEARRVAGH